MAEALITRRGGSGGLNISNGSIQQYYADNAEIEPQTFVESVGGFGAGIAGVSGRECSAAYGCALLGNIMIVCHETSTSSLQCLPAIKTFIIGERTNTLVDTLSLSGYGNSPIGGAQVLAVSNNAVVVRIVTVYDSSTYGAKSCKFIYLTIDDDGHILETFTLGIFGAYYTGSTGVMYPTDNENEIILSYNTSSNKVTTVTKLYSVGSNGFTFIKDITCQCITKYLGNNIGVGGKNIYSILDGITTLEYTFSCSGTLAYIAQSSETSILVMSYSGTTYYIKEVYFENNVWNESDTFSFSQGTGGYGVRAICHVRDDIFFYCCSNGSDSTYNFTLMNSLVFSNHSLVSRGNFNINVLGYNCRSNPYMESFGVKKIIVGGNGSSYGPQSGFNINTYNPYTTIKQSETSIFGVTKSKVLPNEFGEVYILN